MIFLRRDYSIDCFLCINIDQLLQSHTMNVSNGNRNWWYFFFLIFHWSSLMIFKILSFNVYYDEVKTTIFAKYRSIVVNWCIPFHGDLRMNQFPRHFKQRTLTQIQICLIRNCFLQTMKRLNINRSFNFKHFTTI